MNQKTDLNIQLVNGSKNLNPKNRNMCWKCGSKIMDLTKCI